MGMSLHCGQVVIVEAASCPGMACRTDLVDTHQQCVTIAVQRDRLDVLPMAGGVALAPVLTAAAGPERHPSGGQSAMKRLVVHPAHHEDLTAVVLLHDSGHKAVDVALQARGDLRGEG